MPKAANAHTIPHRLPRPAPPHSLDAELIGLCARFGDLERQADAIRHDAAPGSDAEEAADAAVAAIGLQQKPLVDAICACHATTPAGILARARLLAAWDERSYLEGIEDDRQGPMLLALVRDLMAADWVGA